MYVWIPTGEELRVREARRRTHAPTVQNSFFNALAVLRGTINGPKAEDEGRGCEKAQEVRNDRAVRGEMLPRLSLASCKLQVGLRGTSTTFYCRLTLASDHPPGGSSDRSSLVSAKLTNNHQRHQSGSQGSQGSQDARLTRDNPVALNASNHQCMGIAWAMGHAHGGGGALYLSPRPCKQVGFV